MKNSWFKSILFCLDGYSITMFYDSDTDIRIKAAKCQLKINISAAASIFRIAQKWIVLDAQVHNNLRIYSQFSLQPMSRLVRHQDW